MTFKSRMELEEFIRLNVPVGIRPKGKSKYQFMCAFASSHALETVVRRLTDSLWDKLNEPIK